MARIAGREPRPDLVKAGAKVDGVEGGGVVGGGETALTRLEETMVKQQTDMLLQLVRDKIGYWVHVVGRTHREVKPASGMSYRELEESISVARKDLLVAEQRLGECVEFIKECKRLGVPSPYGLQPIEDLLLELDQCRNSLCQKREVAAATAATSKAKDFAIRSTLEREGALFVARETNGSWKQRSVGTQRSARIGPTGSTSQQSLAYDAADGVYAEEEEEVSEELNMQPPLPPPAALVLPRYAETPDVVSHPPFVPNHVSEPNANDVADAAERQVVDTEEEETPPPPVPEHKELENKFEPNVPKPPVSPAQKFSGSSNGRHRRDRRRRHNHHNNETQADKNIDHTPPPSKPMGGPPLPPGAPAATPSPSSSVNSPPAAVSSSGTSTSSSSSSSYNTSERECESGGGLDQQSQDILLKELRELNQADLMDFVRRNVSEEIRVRNKIVNYSCSRESLFAAAYESVTGKRMQECPPPQTQAPPTAKPVPKRAAPPPVPEPLKSKWEKTPQEETGMNWPQQYSMLRWVQPVRDALKEMGILSFMETLNNAKGRANSAAFHFRIIKAMPSQDHGLKYVVEWKRGDCIQEVAMYTYMDHTLLKQVCQVCVKVLNNNAAEFPLRVDESKKLSEFRKNKGNERADVDHTHRQIVRALKDIQEVQSWVDNVRRRG